VIVRELGMGGHAAALAERDVRLAFLETLHVVDHRHKDELPQLSKEKQDMVAAMSFVEDYDLTLTLFEWNLAILHLSVRWACASDEFILPLAQPQGLFVAGIGQGADFLGADGRPVPGYP